MSEQWRLLVLFIEGCLLEGFILKSNKKILNKQDLLNLYLPCLLSLDSNIELQSSNNIYLNTIEL